MTPLKSGLTLRVSGKLGEDLTDVRRSARVGWCVEGINGTCRVGLGVPGWSLQHPNRPSDRSLGSAGAWTVSENHATQPERRLGDHRACTECLPCAIIQTLAKEPKYSFDFPKRRLLSDSAPVERNACHREAKRPEPNLRSSAGATGQEGRNARAGHECCTPRREDRNAAQAFAFEDAALREHKPPVVPAGHILLIMADTTRVSTQVASCTKIRSAQRARVRCASSIRRCRDTRRAYYRQLDTIGQLTEGTLRAGRLPSWVKVRTHNFDSSVFLLIASAVHNWSIPCSGLYVLPTTYIGYHPLRSAIVARDLRISGLCWWSRR